MTQRTPEPVEPDPVAPDVTDVTDEPAAVADEATSEATPERTDDDVVAPVDEDAADVAVDEDDEAEPDETADEDADEATDTDDAADAPAAAPVAAAVPVSGAEPLAGAVDAEYTDHGSLRGPVDGKAAWRRLLRMGRPRTTKANLLGALLAIALGVGIATQVQLTNERGLSELSQAELVQVLDNISLRSSRLADEIRELEATRDRLKSGTGSAAEALEQAQKRVDTLGILAGTVGAKGPGITLTITDPQKQVTGPLVLDLVQELRDAGAESIDVGGVRVVASSFIGERDGTLQVDGTAVARPLVVKAIGDPKTLSSAMTIPGGIVETIRQKGANATVAEAEALEITSLHAPVDPKLAKPAE